MGRQGFGGLLSDEQWSCFLRAGTTRCYGDGEPIIRQGERDGAVFLLTEGLVKISMVRADGVEALLTLRGPGESLGELGALSGLPRTVTVVASGTCRTRVLTGAQFRLLTRSTGVEDALWEHVVLRQSESDSLRAEMAALPSGQRLAAALLRLAALVGAEIPPASPPPPGRPKSVMLRLGLSQREMGDLIGLSRGAVAGEFARLRGLGILRTGRQYVAVRDLDRLVRIAEGGD